MGKSNGSSESFSLKTDWQFGKNRSPYATPYEVSESGASEQMTQLIQERLADQPLISDFDYDLFSSITEKILIQPNASVHLQLRNGKMI